MGLFDGKVAIVTGAGRGIGRDEALLLASEGAAVVVNDLGGAATGEGSDQRPAQQVVDEITDAGGKAAANYDDCSDWAGAERLIAQAAETFGRLDVLINNAGILRDKMSFNMTEDEWDAVIKVHLKGHFAPSHFAALYWRQKNKETGDPVNAKIVNTSSESGLYGNAGQANYAAAKAGIASLTIVMARELTRTGVRVNAIAPVALTRLTAALSGAVEGNEELQQGESLLLAARPAAERHGVKPPVAALPSRSVFRTTDRSPLWPGHEIATSTSNKVSVVLAFPPAAGSCRVAAGRTLRCQR